MNKKNVPEVRFRDFSASWDEKALSDIADIVGGGTPSTQISEYWDGDIDWYSPTEIGEKVYADGSVRKITKLGFEKSGARMLPADKTILFTSRAGIGDTAILKRNGCTNQGFQSLVLKNGTDTYFIYSTSNQIKKYALKYASGSTFLEISGKQLGNMELKIPLEPEQKKLGLSFQNVDHLIALHSKKCERLLNVKKVMLEKLFPKDGTDVPEIRFKGFTDSWKPSKLGKLLHLENGYAFKSRYFKKDPTDVIVLTPGSVHIGGGFQEGKGQFYDKSVDVPPRFIFKPNDLFVTMTDLTPSAQALGFPALVPDDGNTYLHNQRLGKLTNFEIDRQFLYQLLCTELSHKKIVLTSSGTTVKHSSPQKILECEHFIPIKEDEQKKVGAFLKRFDDLIYLQSQELIKLKNIKKAMLEKMFV